MDQEGAKEAEEWLNQSRQKRTDVRKPMQRQERELQIISGHMGKHDQERKH